jgi:hypothetical protein
MQELSDYILRPNLHIMGINKGDKMQAKGICNIFNKIIVENLQNLKKRCPFRYRKPLEDQTDMTKIEPLHSILLLKHLAQSTRKEF